VTLLRRADDSAQVNDQGLHLIDDCLSEDWVAAWAAEVVDEIDAYLAKHAAFHTFLEGDD
jgi:hypothetical protein